MGERLDRLNEELTREQFEAEQARREAIQHLLVVSKTLECDAWMPAESLVPDTRAALRALGVTDAEIDDAEKD